MRLTSTNPNFSYVIQKNPSSASIVEKLRKGFLIAGFEKGSSQSYRCIFIDKEGPESSFSPDSYLSNSNSPIFYLNLISSLFRSSTRAMHEMDTYSSDDGVEYENTLTIPFMPLPEQDLISIKNHYKKLTVSLEQWPRTKIYKLSIGGNIPIYSLLHTAQALLFYSIINGEEQYINCSTEGFLDKYMNSCMVASLPYNFIYRIKKHFLGKRETFQKYSEMLEKAYPGSLKLDPSPTLLDARKKWVKQFVREDLPLVDLGSGSGQYVFLSKMVPTYIPIDTDEDCRIKISLKLERKNVQNYEGPYESVDQYFASLEGPRQYLLTEVLEHMDEQDAMGLLRRCVVDGNASSLIITFPNLEFNRFYGVELFRHPDHKWEGTPESINMIKNCLDTTGKPYSMSVEQIGDAIGEDPIRPTYGLFIQVHQD